MDINKIIIEKAVFPMMEKTKGNQIRKKTAVLQSSQSLSAAELKDLQQRKLQRLLHHCIKHVPAYHQYWHLHSLIDTDPYAALANIRPVTKADFIAESATYISADIQPETLIANQTGGSTGEPMRFYMDRNQVEHYEAARWRGLSWYGISFGSRCLMIWGNQNELSKIEKGSLLNRERLLKNRLVISSHRLGEEDVDAIVKKINHFKPEYIYGYANALYLVAQYILLCKPLDHHLKAVVSTAEVLHDYQRQAIASAFSCPVVNEYGAKDAGILAYQCPCGSMHISTENAIIETVSAQTLTPLPTGETGIMLITDLTNYCQPRLRYRLGDMGAIVNGSCSCGINLPVLTNLVGREDSLLVRLDGGYCSGHAFGTIAAGMQYLRGFRIIQKSPRQVQLMVVISEQTSVAKAEMELFAQKCRALLPGAALELVYCDQIEAPPSGKHRYAVRECEL